MEQIAMNSTVGRLVSILLAIVTAGVLLIVPGAAFAQQKLKFSYTQPPGLTKYTQQHALDVGDVPGHQIRIASLHTKFASDSPEYDGVKVVETFGWIQSDYTNATGRFTQYTVSHMANGDMVFSRTEGLGQTTSAADGSGKTSYSTVTTLTGGTGKFASIRGTIKGGGVTDFKTGPNNSPSEGEYWFQK
jgi:hypothetical protein